MEDEMNALQKNETWIIVEKPNDQKIGMCKWVLRVKRDSLSKCIRYNARLVAQGFSQVPRIDFKDTFSPTLKIMSFCMLVGLVASLNLELHHLDVQTTFLHGELDEEVYIQPPYFESAQFPNHVCRLRKSIYGFHQSPLVWYNCLHSFLLSYGYVRLRNKPYIYIYIQMNASNFILIGVFVDDLPLKSNSLSYITICKQELKVSFHQSRSHVLFSSN